MKRLAKFGLLLAAAAAIASDAVVRAAIAGADRREGEQRVRRGADRLLDVRLTVTANRNVTTRFPPVRLQTTRPYQIGMYLPSDMSGTVTLRRDHRQRRLRVGHRDSADAPDVQSGETAALVELVVEPTGSCVPIGGTAARGRRRHDRRAGAAA